MLKQIAVTTLGLLSLSLTAGEAKSNQNHQGKTMQTIELNTRVGALAADLYLPEGVKNPPVVIVTGAWTTVKEQHSLIMERIS